MDASGRRGGELEGALVASPGFHRFLAEHPGTAFGDDDEAARRQRRFEDFMADRYYHHEFERQTRGMKPPPRPKSASAAGRKGASASAARDGDRGAPREPAVKDVLYAGEREMHARARAAAHAARLRRADAAAAASREAREKARAARLADVALSLIHI